MENSIGFKLKCIGTGQVPHEMYFDVEGNKDGVKFMAYAKYTHSKRTETLTVQMSPKDALDLANVIMKASKFKADE